EAFDERGGAQAAPQLAYWVLRRCGDGAEIEQPGWLPRAVAQVPSAFDIPCVQARRAGLRVWCLGELAGVWRFVTIAGRIPPGAARRIARLLAIFRHLLALIDRYERDALTGLLNRQSFDYRFEELLERHRQNPRRARVGTMPWLAIADIDHYKRINDTWGHLYGDEILLLFSRLMRESFRSDDLLFRYGGEEFVLILNNTTAQGALSALERFRESIGNYAFPTVGRVTVSIGWVCIQPNALPSDLMHKADKALYHAKGHGRNQVTSYEATFGELEEAPQESSVDLF
ncbi:MAG: GGDEF domain-containing protein, partial [Gammaproteobacteria bacterium]